MGSEDNDAAAAGFCAIDFHKRLEKCALLNELGPRERCMFYNGVSNQHKQHIGWRPLQPLFDQPTNQPTNKPAPPPGELPFGRYDSAGWHSSRSGSKCPAALLYRKRR